MKTKIRRHFSELTEKEVRGMSLAMEEAAYRYARRIHMSGLSDTSVHNVYSMVQDGLKAEWIKSKEVMAALKKGYGEET